MWQFPRKYSLCYIKITTAVTLLWIYNHSLGKYKIIVIRFFIVSSGLFYCRQDINQGIWNSISFTFSFFRSEKSHVTVKNQRVHGKISITNDNYRPTRFTTNRKYDRNIQYHFTSESSSHFWSQTESNYVASYSGSSCISYLALRPTFYVSLTF